MKLDSSFTIGCVLITQSIPSISRGFADHFTRTSSIHQPFMSPDPIPLLQEYAETSEYLIVDDTIGDKGIS
jgi:hypothetical protein